GGGGGEGNRWRGWRHEWTCRKVHGGRDRAGGTGDSSRTACHSRFVRQCVAGGAFMPGPTIPVGGAVQCVIAADFNGDGNIGTDADIEAFFRVLGGGNC
ncbi:MAG TPA: hypothetical protein VD997_18195, partial [Phycisphaerales bacterium]|nr:hypothetical protein [Phycisphaerales bacterium]